MFAGYWNRPDSTVEATSNLWFHTGDLGRIDEGGHLLSSIRKKDALAAPGREHLELRVEKVLFSHAAIKDVAVHRGAVATR